MARAIRDARRRVLIAGWCMTPGFALEREGGRATVRELLHAAAARGVEVRVLLWAGAPAGIMQPDRKTARAHRDGLEGDGVRVALDARERPIHCHHEKLVVADDEVAFVGGIDMTDSTGDRFDGSEHPYTGRLGWHDLAVRLRGPVAADVADHLAARWQAVTGERLAPATPAPGAGDSAVQLVRTLPERLYDFAPEGDFRILEAYRRGLRSAKRLVHLENQFLWAPEVVGILAEKLRHPPCDEFRIVVVLPSRANNGQEDTRGQLAILEQADDGAGRFLATTIAAVARGRVSRVYVHAKIAIVDDRWLTLGSANINARGLYNDSEVNIVTCDPRAARAARLRLWAEHLERSEDEIAGDPTEVIDRQWRPIAAEQLARSDRGDPRSHRLSQLVSRSWRASLLLGSLDGVVVDG
jgi:phosphatidylserine/phosphatidylglycerophosphate/cardiolipin synthase-like enzyme